MRNLLAAKAQTSPKCQPRLTRSGRLYHHWEVCTHYYDNKMSHLRLAKQVETAIVEVEEDGSKIWRPQNSASAIRPIWGPRFHARCDGNRSTSASTTKLSKASLRNQAIPAFLHDVYRRLSRYAGDVVMGVRPEGIEIDPFEQLIEEEATSAASIRQ